MNLGIPLGLGARSVVGFEAPLTLNDLSRPALVLSEFYNAFGDSTTAGVGAPAGQDWPSQFRVIADGPTGAFNGGSTGNNGSSIVEIGNGGIGGENSTSITGRIVALASSHPAQVGRTSFYNAGLNDYNTVVPGFARDWPAQVKTNYTTAAATLTGGKRLLAPLAVASNRNHAGTRQGANHLFHEFDMAASFGNLAFDLHRYMRFVRQLEAPSGTADAYALSIGALPYKYRGGTDFADVDFPRLTGSADPANLNHPEGTIFNQTVAGTSWRKLGASGSGSWELTDDTHFSKYGYAVIARIAGDMAIAEEGNGPPVVCPDKFRIAADAPAGTVVGQVRYNGAADRFGLRTYADGAVADFAISNTGQITKVGSGALTQGVTELVVIAKNEHGTLLSPVDIYVARPSTQTAPALRTVAAPYLSIAGTDFHGMTNGKTISGAFWIEVDDLATTQQIMLFARTSTPTQPVSIQIATNGRLVTNIRDADNTLISPAASGTAALTVGNAAWVTFAFDFATNTRCAYIGETALSLGSITNGVNIPLADSNPLFLSGNSVQLERTLTTPFRGKVGYFAFWDKYVDWTDSANRRLLYNTDGTAVSRTPYAAVGGHVPAFELWGGVGDWLWGTPDGSVSPKILSTAHRARALLT
jgi:lysophospholipase L1-like esterase